MPTASKKKGRNGTKKYNRGQRKVTGRGSAISKFVRGKITADEYFKVTGQKAR